MKRIKIPKQTKEIVWHRQKGGCACCIERGRHYHHVLPVSMDSSNSSDNIVLLCKEHHNLLHLGDLETCLTILEYVYYIKNMELPHDTEQIKELAEKIKKDNKIKKIKI